MNSYQYQLQQFQTSENSGGGSKAAGTSDNFSYSSGVGSVATSAKGKFWSGSSYGDRYGSNDLGRGQSYSSNVRIFACSVVRSYQTGDAPMVTVGSNLLNYLGS